MPFLLPCTSFHLYIYWLVVITTTIQNRSNYGNLAITFQASHQHVI